MPKDFNCILGVSGVDSTYACYIAKKNGLRPIAVHLIMDGILKWQSQMKNIKKLEIDLFLCC